jgi:serine/threonine protein kinase
MALININSFNHKTDMGTDIEIKFFIKHADKSKLPNFLVYGESTYSKTISLVVNVCDFLGEGSYGSVYKIKIGDKYYAIKLSENEIPNKLLQRYKSLCLNEKLKKHIIKIYSCGEINKVHGGYKYYCIMEYGGSTLKSVIANFNVQELKSVLKQLYNIVYQSCKFRLLITDFKLGNLTITSKNKIKLIDIYMECDNYSPCTGCRIVKTYSTIELDKEKRIYESSSYNYTGIYIPFAICLIELICEDSISYYVSKLCKKFNLNLTVKQMVPLLQVACYNFNNENNDPIKKYKSVEKFKKMLESEFKILRSNDFYEYFLNLLEPKAKYADFISKKKLFLILNDLFTMDPEQRSLKYLKNKLISEDDVNINNIRL